MSEQQSVALFALLSELKEYDVGLTHDDSSMLFNYICIS